MKQYRYLDVITASFVAVLLMSNVASSAKIIDWQRELFGLQLAFDAGTLLFPLSYIFGDILTEVYGYARARRVIWIGFLWATLMAVCFAIIEWMPGEYAWQEYAGDDAYAAIIGGVSTGGIIIASLCAYLVGEFSNSITLSVLKVRMQGRMLWVRTIGSTLIGQATDTALFVLIACSFGVFPWEIAVSLIVANYIFKVGIEVILTPATYAIVGFLKEKEQEDHYDTDVSYSPFSL